MTAYNNHTLSQGAIAVARESAAREQREKDAALLRRLADEAEAGVRGAKGFVVYGYIGLRVASAKAAALRAAADLIEAGTQ